MYITCAYYSHNYVFSPPLIINMYHKLQLPPDPPYHPRGCTSPLITYKWHDRTFLIRPPYLTLKSGDKFESCSRSKEHSTRCCIFGVFGLSELIDWREDQYLFYPMTSAGSADERGEFRSFGFRRLVQSHSYSAVLQWTTSFTPSVPNLFKCRWCEKIGAKSVWHTRCVSILVPKHLFASPCAPSKQ